MRMLGCTTLLHEAKRSSNVFLEVLTWKRRWELILLKRSARVCRDYFSLLCYLCLFSWKEQIKMFITKLIKNSASTCQRNKRSFGEERSIFALHSEAPSDRLLSLWAVITGIKCVSLILSHSDIFSASMLPARTPSHTRTNWNDSLCSWIETQSKLCAKRSKLRLFKDYYEKYNMEEESGLTLVGRQRCAFCSQLESEMKIYFKTPVWPPEERLGIEPTTLKVLNSWARSLILLPNSFRFKAPVCPIQWDLFTESSRN